MIDRVVCDAPSVTWNYSMRCTSSNGDMGVECTKLFVLLAKTTNTFICIHITHK